MSKPKPSIDLGYPTEAYGRAPTFTSIEEQAEFWDTHDVTQVVGVELHPVDVDIAPDLIHSLTVTLELDRQDLDDLLRLAQDRGIAPSTLARICLEERLHEESKADLAHRRLLARRADQPCLVGQGRHHELVTADGIYRELHEAQFGALAAIRP